MKKAKLPSISSNTPKQHVSTKHSKTYTLKTAKKTLSLPTYPHVRNYNMQEDKIGDKAQAMGGGLFGF